MNPAEKKSNTKTSRRSPEVSVIIPSYNGGRMLLSCLSSIPEKDTEVIVIDNGSKDGSIQRARADFPKVKFKLMGRNTGFAYACNRGAQEARGKILLFLNQDAELVKEGFFTVAKFLSENPDRVIATGKVVYPDGSTQEILRRFPGYFSFLFGRKTILTRLFPRNPGSRHYLYADIDYSNVQRIDACAGMCMFARRDIFLDLGGFDEGYFFYMEDVDLCKRTQEAGYETWYLPKVTAVHLVGENVPGSRTFVKMNHYKGIYRYLSIHKKPVPILRGLLWLGTGLAIVAYLSSPRLC